MQRIQVFARLAAEREQFASQLQKYRDGWEGLCVRGQATEKTARKLREELVSATQRARLESRGHAWFRGECKAKVGRTGAIAKAGVASARAEALQLQHGVLDLQSEAAQWRSLVVEAELHADRHIRSKEREIVALWAGGRSVVKEEHFLSQQNAQFRGGLGLAEAHVAHDREPLRWMREQLAEGASVIDALNGKVAWGVSVLAGKDAEIADLKQLVEEKDKEAQQLRAASETQLAEASGAQAVSQQQMAGCLRQMSEMRQYLADGRSRSESDRAKHDDVMKQTPKAFEVQLHGEICKVRRECEGRLRGERDASEERRRVLRREMDVVRVGSARLTGQFQMAPAVVVAPHTCPFRGSGRGRSSASGSRGSPRGGK